MFKRILVPVDGSFTSNKALVAALGLARDCGAQLRLMHAMDDLAYMCTLECRPELLTVGREYAARVLDDALAIAKAAGIEADVRLVEEPGVRLGASVADEAKKWGADLIVAGTHGRTGLDRVLLGSGAEQIIRLAMVPVLVVRNDEESKSAAPAGTS